MYPLTALYDALTIEKWTVDTNSEQFKDGYRYVCSKYWRLDVYSEKTVIYDQNKFEGEYVPLLCKVWDVITNCNALKIDGGNRSDGSDGSDRCNIANYIEEIEKNKDSPFYNENKIKKRAKLDKYNEENGILTGGIKEEKSDEDINPNIKIFAKAFKPNKDIELDF